MNIHELPTPCYVIDEKKLKENLEILRQASRDRHRHAGSCWPRRHSPVSYEYPLIGQTIWTVPRPAAFIEARLGYEEMGKPFGLETHVFAPAFKEAEIGEIADICDHVIFNSFCPAGKIRGLLVCRKNGVSIGTPR